MALTVYCNDKIQRVILTKEIKGNDMLLKSLIFRRKYLDDLNVAFEKII